MEYIFTDKTWTSIHFNYLIVVPLDHWAVPWLSLWKGIEDPNHGRVVWVVGWACGSLVNRVFSFASGSVTETIPSNRDNIVNYQQTRNRAQGFERLLCKVTHQLLIREYESGLGRSGEGQWRNIVNRKATLKWSGSRELVTVWELMAGEKFRDESFSMNMDFESDGGWERTGTSF